MGAKTLWNYNAHFDYVDRYMAISNGDSDPFGYTVDREASGNRPTGLVGAMYDTYRNNYRYTTSIGTGTAASIGTGTTVTIGN